MAEVVWRLHLPTAGSYCGVKVQPDINKIKTMWLPPWNGSEGSNWESVQWKGGASVTVKQRKKTPLHINECSADSCKFPPRFEGAKEQGVDGGRKDARPLFTTLTSPFVPWWCMRQRLPWSTTEKQQHFPVMETDGTAPTLSTLWATKIDLTRHCRLRRGPWPLWRGPSYGTLNVTAPHVCRRCWVRPQMTHGRMGGGTDGRAPAQVFGWLIPEQRQTIGPLVPAGHSWDYWAKHSMWLEALRWVEWIHLSHQDSTALYESRKSGWDLPQ